MSDEDWDAADYGAGAGNGTKQHSRSRDEQQYRNSGDSRNNTQRKRDYETGDREEKRGRRNENCSETIDISQNQIGAVIGRGGSNIRELQSKFSVRVDIDRASNRVSVSGGSQGDVSDAVAHIRSQLDDAQNRRGDRNDRGGGRSDRNDRYNDRDNRSDRNDRYNDRDNRSDRNDRYNDRGSSRNYGDRGGNDRYNDRQGHDEYKPKESDYGGSNKNDWYTSGSNGRDRDASPSNGGGNTIDWGALNKKAEEDRRARWAKCPEMIKDFYEEHDEVANLSPDMVDTIRRDNNDTVVDRVFKENADSSKPIPNPIWKFDQCFAKYPDLMEEIVKQGFEKPSPIQAQAWPVLLSGEDLIGIAQTGTGKTLAFLLPAMIHTEYQPGERPDGPNVLVLAPTRELAQQIEKEVAKYSFRGMRAVCVYGGGDRKEQIKNVSEGVEIIIATPGRLNDLIEAKVIKVDSITFLILDEADRMLDMGFEPQIRKILLDVRPDRQTVMTSATWPPSVRRLAQSYMNNPIQVCVGTLDLAATHSVTQKIAIMDEEDKFFRILQFIKNMQPNDKAIIFCGKKARADDLSSELTLKSIECQCIHGSRDQSDREQAIADIKSGYVKLLIATDVASRGLDIEDITYVVNFDFPRNIEEYVHRVGRTGRAGRKGTSITFMTKSDWSSAHELIPILEEADQEVPDELRQMAKRFAAMKERRNNEAAMFGDRRGGGRNRY